MAINPHSFQDQPSHLHLQATLLLAFHVGGEPPEGKKKRARRYRDDDVERPPALLRLSKKKSTDCFPRFCSEPTFLCTTRARISGYYAFIGDALMRGEGRKAGGAKR
jgi:hypothetical protein